MNKNHFVYKLIPPRPTFAEDMTEAEQAVMGEHTVYWTELFDRGQVVLRRRGRTGRRLGARRRRGGR